MHGSTIAKAALQTDQFQNLFNQGIKSSALFNNCLPGIYLMNYTTGKFQFASNSLSSIMGCYCHEHQEYDLNFILEHYDSRHLQLFNEEIFPDRLKFLKTISPEKHKNYVFTYTFKFRTDCGKTLSLLHRNRYLLSGEKHQPLVSFGILSKIEHFKTITPVIQTIEHAVDDGSMNDSELVSKKIYYIEKDTCLFSKRERELLPYLADGMSSKEIADQLSLSEFTIINHRKNMLIKSHSHNMV